MPSADFDLRGVLVTGWPWPGPVGEECFRFLGRSSNVVSVVSLSLPLASSRPLSLPYALYLAAIPC